MAGVSNAPALEAARIAAELTLAGLWHRYFALTGQASPLELEAILLGALVPDPLQYDIIVHALNERLAEIRRAGTIAYSDELG